MECRIRIARAVTCKRRSRPFRAPKFARRAPFSAGPCRISRSSVASPNQPSRARKNSTSCPACAAATLLQSAPRLKCTASSLSTIPACAPAYADKIPRQIARSCPAHNGGRSLNFSALPFGDPIGLLDCDGGMGHRGLRSLLLELRLAEAVGASLGDWLIVAVDAGHADAADAVIVEQQRIAALHAEIVRRHQELGPLPHPLAEGAARPAAQRGGARFRGRHVDRVHAIDVRSLEIKQMPALVDHCDCRLPLEPGGMLLGGSDNALNIFSRQARLVAHGFIPFGD